MNVFEYFKSNKKLNDELKRKESQIELMREHIMEQRTQIIELKRKLKITEQLWDIASQRKTY